METKKCKYCQENKTLDNFYYRKKSNNYENRCRKCCAEIAREKRKNKDVNDKVKKSQKKYYEKNKDKLNDKNKSYYEDNKEKFKENNKSYYKDNAEVVKKRMQKNREELKIKALAGQLKKPTITDKTCTKCKLSKNVSNFTFRKTRNIYESVCKTCNRDRERKRREQYKDKINLQRKELPKKALSPQNKLGEILRKRANYMIINRDKKNYYLELVGCNRKFFLKWFEYNFELDEHCEMNWDNYGSHWQIDHVTPCTSYDLTDKKQQLQCFHWTNTSPVFKHYNLSKGAQIKPIDQMRQEIRVRNFLKTTKFDNTYKYSEKS